MTNIPPNFQALGRRFRAFLGGTGTRTPDTPLPPTPQDTLKISTERVLTSPSKENPEVLDLITQIKHELNTDDPDADHLFYTLKDKMALLTSGADWDSITNLFPQDKLWQVFSRGAQLRYNSRALQTG
jgi:hypothetical protein